ncbi:MAG TPA: DUF6624 domain-containing protein [Thermoanaerobaculia bacterium]|nr:DUF6624 domain-containing protein [Thermoanaerobaculia bacterium]
MRALAALSLILLAACVTAPAPPPAPAPQAEPEPTNPALAAELRAMIDADQEVRRRWIKDRTNASIQAEMEALSKQQVARLQQIVDQHGWPGKTLAGVKGGGAAWTIAQHGGPDFLGRMLPLMYEAVKKGELEEALYATSLDRVLVNRGQKQMYGTQFDTDPATGKCEPKPIDDPERVDERRLRAGMGTLAEYREQLCKLYLGK